MNNERLVALVALLMKLLRVPVTAASVRKELLHHPDVNSLAAVSDVLNRWKISNSAYRVSINQLTYIPCPFVSQFSTERSDFFVVHEIDNGKVYFIDGYNYSHEVPIQEFSEIFSGVILVCDVDATSGERDYKRKRIEYFLNYIRIPVIILLVLLLLCVAVYFHSSYFELLNWKLVCLTLTKLCGLIIGLILFEESSGKTTVFVKKFCSGDSFNCGDVLSSKHSKILWGLVSWSDIGVLYFSSTFLILLFGVQSPSIVGILSLLSLLCILYSIFSIYY